MSDVAAVASAAASAISAVVAIVLAVITYKYLVATREIRSETARSVASAQEMVTEVQRQRMDALRPIVTVTFSPGTSVHDQYSLLPRKLEATLAPGARPYLMLHNAGPGAALDVRLRIMINLEPSSPHGWSGHLLLRGAVLGPDVYWPLWEGLDSYPLLQATTEQIRARFEVTYCDSYGRIWQTRVDLPMKDTDEPNKRSISIGATTVQQIDQAPDIDAPPPPLF